MKIRELNEFQIDKITSYVKKNYKSDIDYFEERVIAFGKALDLTVKELKQIELKDNLFIFNNKSFLVFTYDEADVEAYNRVYNMLTECHITHEVRKTLGWLVNYVDIDAATTNLIRSQGITKQLTEYQEIQVLVNDTFYYIYEQ